MPGPKVDYWITMTITGVLWLADQNHVIEHLRSSGWEIQQTDPEKTFVVRAFMQIDGPERMVSTRDLAIDLINLILNQPTVSAETRQTVIVTLEMDAVSFYQDVTTFIDREIIVRRKAVNGGLWERHKPRVSEGQGRE